MIGFIIFLYVIVPMLILCCTGLIRMNAAMVITGFLVPIVILAILVPPWVPGIIVISTWQFVVATILLFVAILTPFVYDPKSE